jgi:predicted aspartyl protease
MIAR